MPLSICAELREESKVSRQIAATEGDTHLKELWATHALSLALLAEKVECTHKALLKQVDDLKTASLSG